MTHLHGITARQYDSGGRYIENDPEILPLGGTAHIRRQGNRVTCKLANIPRTYNAVIFNIPTGFKGQGTSVGGALKPEHRGTLISMTVMRGANGADAEPQRFGFTGNQIRFHGSAVSEGNRFMEAEWFTHEVEPVTLPGVPDLYQPPYS